MAASSEMLASLERINSRIEILEVSFQEKLHDLQQENQLLKTMIADLNNSSNIINEIGFEAHIDFLIDSDEYNNYFGEDIVPYMRSWNSPIGFKTKSFLETSYLTKAFATSDLSLIHI